MAQTIGSQDGIKASFNRLRDLDPGGTLLVKGADGKWPDISTLDSTPIDKWKAYDKWQRCEQIEKNDHDAGGQTPLPPDVSTDLDSVRRRIFLAQEPLDPIRYGCPSYMVPVCTADLGYRSYYTPDVIDQLRDYFGLVEAWCDCKPGQTPYSTAVQMVKDLGLDGPAWGECEAQAAFDAC